MPRRDKHYISCWDKKEKVSKGMEIMCLGNGRASQMMGVQGTSNDSEKGGWGWVLMILEYYSKRSELFRGRNSNYFVLIQSLSHLYLCDPTDCSMPGFSVLHYLSEFAQTHVYWVSDTIQPSPALLPPSPHVLNLSQHQGLFQWVSSSHQVAKVLEL